MTTAQRVSERPHRRHSPPHEFGVPNYSVIKGRPVAARVFPPRDPTRDQPHYHIHILAQTQHFDVAVNVHSSDGSQVLYRVGNAVRPPNESALAALQPGLHTIGSGGADGLGLDFIRQNLVRRDQMQLLDMGPATLTDAPVEEVMAEAARTALHNAIDTLIQSAIGQPQAEVYAFGSAFHNPGRNPFFGFSPDDGAHNIHMNQGNPMTGPFSRDNGIYKDGALFIRFPDASTWQAVFVAFQSQSWHTDDRGRPS